MEADRLDDIPAFADLSDEERAEIATRLREAAVEPGTALVTEGDNAWEWFVIRSGHAAVLKDGKTVRTLGPGDVFGEIGLMATGSRTASVVSTSPMRVLAMFLADFRELEQRLPALSETVRRHMREDAARTGF